MTEQENLILDGVLRDEPFICCHDGYAYFLGPEAPTELNWQDAINWWCKSLGDEYELPSKEILNECYENESIRKEFVQYWYWSSTVYEKYDNCAWCQDFDTGFKDYSYQSRMSYVRAVRKIKI
jgi:hypothetical protein